MTVDDIGVLFAEVLPVRVRRMFGGHGIYDGATMFALEVAGEIYLKVDDRTRPLFGAAGSTPFVYPRKGREVELGYWRLPAEALDDPALLREWTALARRTARDAAVTRRG